MRDISSIAAFTGHRPEKLSTDSTLIIKRLSDEISRAVESGYTTFISGMSRGVDLWAGNIITGLMKENSSISLICALPYRNYKIRTGTDKKLFNEILASASEIIYTDEKYNYYSYDKRDKWMVDNCSMLIAVYEGIKGGTENTVNYAFDTGKNVVFV